MPAATVIASVFVFCLLLFPHLLQIRFGTETGVSVLLLKQLLRVFLVVIQPLGLNVWTAIPFDPRSFVEIQSRPAEGFHQVLRRAVHLAALVGILDSQNKAAAHMPGIKIIEQGGSQSPHMQKPGWARSKSKSGFSHFYECLYYKVE